MSLRMLVVGYSGANDPVFDHLSQLTGFDNGLYWVGYRDDEPAVHVHEQLLLRNGGAFYTSGYDADEFFIKLTQELGIFPPEIISHPFSHLEHVFETFTPFTPNEQVSGIDVTATPREWVRSAIDIFEKPDATVEAQRLFMSGDYRGVVALYELQPGPLSPVLAEFVSGAYVLLAEELFRQAKAGEDADRDHLLDQAAEKYQAALSVQQDRHDALNNWGNLLAERGKRATKSDEGWYFFEQAIEQFQAALDINPRNEFAFFNWGNTLVSWAKSKSGKEAVELLKRAKERYENSLVINPSKWEAICGWGNALLELAKRSTPEEADDYFNEANDKYRRAHSTSPEQYQTLLGWGNVLLEWSRTKKREEAVRLIGLATEKFHAAHIVKPNSDDVLNNWGSALADQAKSAEGDSANVLFSEAVDKYRAALTAKPGRKDTLRNLGTVLMEWAKTKTGEEADHFFEQAGEIFAQLEWEDPGFTAYNLACLNALRGQEAGCRQWMEKGRQLGTLPDRYYVMNDPDLVQYQGREWLIALLR